MRFPAGEVGGGAGEEAGVEPDGFEGPHRVTVVEGWLRDEQVVADRAGERRGTLEHHPDAPSELERVLVGDVVAAEQDPAGARKLEPVAAAEQRGLPGPRRAGEDGDPIGWDGAGRAIEAGAPISRDGDVLEAKQGGGVTGDAPVSRWADRRPGGRAVSLRSARGLAPRRR